MRRFGAVAQLGERRVRNAKVRGSIPLSSTKSESKVVQRGRYHPRLRDARLRMPDGRGHPHSITEQHSFTDGRIKLVDGKRVVQAVLQGRRRVLLCMATGTGKTMVASQICWKLWSARWNRQGATASRASCSSPTATSWWTTPRTRPSPRSATLA